jgi:ubiquinone/menaquinone biosynthesis C-methylase UbiE
MAHGDTDGKDERKDERRDEREDAGELDVRTLDIKQKQQAYHDWEARTYEEKFSISYDERCIDYARDRFRKVVRPDERFARVLELGAGTGFFSINLALAGCLDGAAITVTDISQGMLDVCVENGRRHGLALQARAGDSEALPFDDASFDLVIGHAFLHHMPDPVAALAEAFRVLAPGGTLVIAGEPTRIGDRIARVFKRATWHGLQALTTLPRFEHLRRPSVTESGGSARDAALAGLEHEVDLHTFDPADLAASARLVGLAPVRVVTEELLANWVGWSVRTIEASVRPGVLDERWAFGAYRTWLRLSRVDAALEGLVPRKLFYNLILHARRPLAE